MEILKRLELSIKMRIERLFNRLGYNIQRRAPPDMVPINVFQLAVSDLLARRRPDENFFFIQIGAHDGLHFDPIRPLVQKHYWHYWRGIPVEPQPKIFARLLENYRDEPQLQLENAAIYERDGDVKLYVFKDNQGLPDHATMLASLDRGGVVCNTHGYKGQIEELTVPALSV
jgi:FkbM family methyltransferase